MIKYVKRTSKKLRQEVLDKALTEELECLRKRVFPWQRREFLSDPIEVKEKIFVPDEEGTTLGLYKYDEKEMKHYIYINKSYVYSTQKFEYQWLRNSYYKQVREVLRHELIHAFVKEQFEYKLNSFITQKERDASPIFLAVLYFCNGYTSHDCFTGFMKTDLYKKIRYGHFDNYKELKKYLQNMLFKFAENINEIQKITNEDSFKKGLDKNLLNIVNEFEFAPRINGFNKFNEVNYEDVFVVNGNKRTYHNISRTWQIGCNVDPKQLIKLYKKKENCKAKYYDTKRQLIIPSENLTEVKKVIKFQENKNY